MKDLSDDIILRIAENCDLESCVALSQTSVVFSRFFRGLGGQKSFLQEKVQRRVPWMKIGDSDAETWIQCANLVVSRSRAGLDASNDHLYLLKDLRPAIWQGKNDPQFLPYHVLMKDDEFRTSMTPVFDDPLDAGLEEESDGEDCEIEGTWVDFKEGCKVDLRTMTKTYVPPDTIRAVSIEYEETCSFSDESPSGLTVVNGHFKDKLLTGFDDDCEDDSDRDDFLDDYSDDFSNDGETKFWVHVVGENEKLLHVRFGGEDDQQYDTLIYKDDPNVKRNAQGAYVVHDQMVPLFAPPEGQEEHMVTYEPEFSGSLVCLLPGCENGGALIVTSPDSQRHRQMLCYVEPTKELEPVLICTLPLSMTYNQAYSDVYTQFFTTFDGYLFLIHRGVFYRLWVDLGYRSEFDRELGVDVVLSENADNRCLTVWNSRFPVLGEFVTDDVYNKDEPYGGFRIAVGKERYVTLPETMGKSFGDMRTGKTYFCGVSHRHTAFPVVTKDGLAFAGLPSRILYEITLSASTRMETQYQDGTFGEDEDMNEDYKKITSEALVYFEDPVQQDDMSVYALGQFLKKLEVPKRLENSEDVETYIQTDRKMMKERPAIGLHGSYREEIMMANLDNLEKLEQVKMDYMVLNRANMLKAVT